MTTEIRPTPETDAQCYDCEYLGGMGGKFTADAGKLRPDGEHVPADFARKLERERDEAREQLEAMREAIKDAHYALAYVHNDGAGSCAFPYRTDDDLCSENRFHHVKDALDALKPFLND